jgi:hypothetical protein
MDEACHSRDFLGILKQKEPTLASQVKGVQQRGLQDWVHLLVPEMGSHAGIPHLRNVERIANRIIPDDLKDDFTTGEIFLLLSAIFLHDIGRAMLGDEKEPCKEKPEECAVLDHVKGCDNSDDHRTTTPPCHKKQWSHHIKGEEIIKIHGLALGLPDERVAQYCGLLTFCHGLRRPPTEEQPLFVREGRECKKTVPARGSFRTTSLAPYGIIRIPLLASILRIADETDNLWTRALRKFSHDIQKDSARDMGKAFRRCIEDIEFCHDGQCLVVHIPDMTDLNGESLLTESAVESINNVRDSMSTVVTEWGKALSETGVRFKEVYIEYRDALYTTFDPKGKAPPLGKAVVEENRKAVEKLLDAMIQLALGSYGYPRFTWRSLEAQVGRPLTNVDKWLVGRMGNSSPHLSVLITSEPQELEINVDRREVEAIRREVVGEMTPGE